MAQWLRVLLVLWYINCDCDPLRVLAKDIESQASDWRLSNGDWREIATFLYVVKSCPTRTILETRKLFLKFEPNRTTFYYIQKSGYSRIAIHEIVSYLDTDSEILKIHIYSAWT